ncbi:MAG: serine/threonine-protein kinase [Polyangiales bacterium]
MAAPLQVIPATPGAELPRVFGRYMLFDHIGRGGMADIFLARENTGLGSSRRVVVKRVLPHLSRDPDFARMLIHEAKLAAQLNHANIVQVFDLGRESGRLFIAMEYVEGFDLHQLLVRLSKAKIPLPAEFGLLIVREVLRALDYAHRARGLDGRPLGLVHRDVSPTNVLVSFEGEVKLCDFGIARALARPDDGVDENTAARARLAGKAAYMAPEMARGEDVNARADIYAAGVLLWELCAGRRMIRGTPEEMFARAREGNAPPLPGAKLREHAILQAILDRALGRDPIDRYLTAADFLADLDTYAARTKLLASQLKFGEFLAEHFAENSVSARREREQASEPVWLESFPPETDAQVRTPDISAVRRIPRTPVPARPENDSGSVSVWGWGMAVLGAAAALGALVRWLAH